MEFTVRQYAKKEQVTIRTVYNWLLKDAVDYRRTPGGGIRIIDPPRRAVVLDMKSTTNKVNPSK